MLLLQAVAELPEAALQQGLTHLQAAELLYETQLFPERAYTFKHALRHEVAYGSLLQERRRVLHARIVEALEAFDLARKQQARGDEALALRLLGAVHAHADPPKAEQAEAHYRQALTLADELGMRPL